MTSLQYIQSMNLDYVVNHMVQREGWSHADAEEAAQYYRNYLTLALKHPEKTLPPSGDIDEIWHTHVLHTERYAADCDAIFWKFRHHVPAESRGNVFLIRLRDSYFLQGSSIFGITGAGFISSQGHIKNDIL